MKNLLILLTISLLASCCKRNIHTTTKYETKTETIFRDSIRYVDTTVRIDSSVSIVEIRCDSNNKPQLISNAHLSGKRTPSVQNISPGFFQVKCPTDSLRLIIEAKDRTIETLRSEKIFTSTEVEYKKSAFEKAKSILFQVALALFFMVLGAIGYALFSRFK